jgi:DNA polymerase V
MINDHIMDGDIIVVNHNSAVDNGDIVAAQINDEVSVCRLDNGSKPPRLIHANPAYKDIELTDQNTQILGKVVTIIRKCG